MIPLAHLLYIYSTPRDHFVSLSSQWETALLCNILSQWLGAFTKWSLRTPSVLYFLVSFEIRLTTRWWFYPCGLGLFQKVINDLNQKYWNTIHLLNITFRFARIDAVLLPKHLPNMGWWCHQMETFSALLITIEFPTQRPVTQSFDVFFDLRLNQQLSKQWKRWWFEMPLHSLWRHSDEFDVWSTSVKKILITLMEK